MKINWANVSPDMFERVVAELLRAMGYENVRIRTGGIDEGWDIDAETLSRHPDGTLVSELWRVECKRYKKSPPPAMIRDHCRRMIESSPAPDHVLFAATTCFSNPLKKDLMQITGDRKVMVHVWEREYLERQVLEHLRNPDLRSLLGPYIECSLSIGMLREACKKQVGTEIQYRVGRKYLPDLYHNRPIEKEIREFIGHSTERCQVEEFVSFLSSLRWPRTSKSEQKRRDLIISQLRDLKSLRETGSILADLDSLRKQEGFAEQAIGQFGNIYRKCFLVKDKAGSGKTNLFCKLAIHFEENNRVNMFLSCKLDVPDSGRLSEVILDYLLPYIEEKSKDTKGHVTKFSDTRELINEVFLTLEKNDSELVIFLDGINENRNLAALDEAIIKMFIEWNHQPVRFVVSCRDIFWSFFGVREWKRFLYKNKTFDLPEFENNQVDIIIGEYFKKFDIKGQVVDQAREKCRHPLLLRFFCEAYSGRDIRVYYDIRLKDLFEEYWNRKCQELSDALGWGQDGGYRVEEFVFAIAEWMCNNKTTQLALGYIPTLTGDKDVVSDRSIYQRLLDQNIILEELPPETSFDRSYGARRISFVYDEFYDYIVALSYVRKKHWDSKVGNDICLDFAYIVHESREFEQLRGVAEYLVLMSEGKKLHKVLSAVLARMGEFEILCSAVPKLKCETKWMATILRMCLLVVDRLSKVKRKVKDSDGLSFDNLVELLKRTETEKLYETLLSME